MSERDMLTDAEAAVLAELRRLPPQRAPAVPLGMPVEEAAPLLARAALQGAGVLSSLDQDPPVPNEHPSLHDLLDSRLAAYGAHMDTEGARFEALELLRAWNGERRRIGLVKYHTILQPHNNREAVKDALLEGLDFLVYLEQKIFELIEDPDNRASLVLAHKLTSVQEDMLRHMISLAVLVRPEFPRTLAAVTDPAPPFPTPAADES